MRFGSLFSGFGGMDLGLERAGMRCAWQVEIEPYARKVLAKHWPQVRRFRDVRFCGKKNLEKVDLIAGGFPCQPHSLAGDRAASRDRRNLWPEFHRIICETQPEWVLAENVLGILSSEKGRFFGGILRDLAECGYDAQWRVFCAHEFGYPHIRKRVFLLAYPVRRGRQLFSLDAPRSGPEKGAQPLDSGAVDSVWGTLARFEQRVAQPSVCGSPDGISHPLERFRGIGNAVIPDIAEHIGRIILAQEEMV